MVCHSGHGKLAQHRALATGCMSAEGSQRPRRQSLERRLSWGISLRMGTKELPSSSLLKAAPFAALDSPAEYSYARGDFGEGQSLADGCSPM